jgi:two-component system chemotaxis response regulator CheB
MIKVLIVDDSNTETQILKNIFESDADLQVVACAKNGKEAIEFNKKYKPHIITMDINMPVMNGIQAINEIMSHQPVPIVVISSQLDAEMQTTYLALDAGALSVMEKPIDINAPNFAYAKKFMISTIKSMAEIRVIKRRFNIKKHHILTVEQTKTKNDNGYEIVAIGTSVGGPQVLKAILSQLPTDFSLPIVIVQHMTMGYMTGFVKWLNDNVAIHVKEACHDEILQGGIVYFAPDHHHLEIERIKEKLISKLTNKPPVSGFCPSATVLLESVATTCGQNAVGVLLTGMGNDGAQGLLEIKHSHGHTIIQDEESAIVFGMAGVAQSIGAVDAVVELDKMSEYLIQLTK